MAVAAGGGEIAEGKLGGASPRTKRRISFSKLDRDGPEVFEIPSVRSFRRKYLNCILAGICALLLLLLGLFVWVLSYGLVSGQD